jgi:hypothetical protein
LKALFFSMCFVLLAGCASSSGSGQSDLITREQIVETGAPTIFEVVKLLRRGWLPYRDDTYTLLVYVDAEGGVLQEWTDEVWAEEDLDMGGLLRNRHVHFLRQGGTENVAQIEWMTPAEAREYFRGNFSIDHTRFYGAIVVRLEGG